MSSFTFGGVRQTSKLKTTEERADFLIAYNIDPSSTKNYLVLVDYVINETRKTYLERDLKKLGIKSYVIASTISIKKPVKKLSSEGLESYESDWRKYLVNEGKKVTAVLCFGNALQVVQKCADTLYFHYIDDVFNSTRVFMSDEFLKGGDVFYYPNYPIDEVYPIEIIQDNYTNYKTRFMFSQIERVQTDDMDPTKTLDMRDYNIVDITTKEEADKLFLDNMHSELMSYDLETTGLHHLLDEIGCLTCSFDGITGYYIPFNLITKRLLKACLTTAKDLVGANAKFDTKFLWANGVTGFLPTQDTQILSHALNSERSKGLKSLAFFYTRFGGYDNMLDVVKKSMKVDNYMQIPHKYLVEYASLDAIVTHRIYKALREHVDRIDENIPNDKMSDWPISRWYEDIMMPYYQDIIKLEYNGIRVNMEQRNLTEAYLKEKTQSLKNKLYELWNPILKEKGHSPIDDKTNILSTKQLGETIEKMGWPKVEESDTGGYGTSDPCLVEWKRLGYPGIDELSDLRSYSVCLNSFVGYVDEDGKKSGWSKYIVEHEDGSFRMHPSFQTMGTSTYRNSVKEPSSQNIPTYGHVGQLAKTCLTSDKMTPNYKVTDDSGKIWEGRGSDYLITERGEIPFYDLVESDVILDYGRKSMFVTALEV